MVGELVYHWIGTRDWGRRTRAWGLVGAMFRVLVRLGRISRQRRMCLDPFSRTTIAFLLAASAVACTRGERTDARNATDDTTAVPADVLPDGDVPSGAAAAASDTALSTGVGSLRGSIDSALAATARRIRPAARARQRQLPPLADSIANKLVFPPVTQSWFLAAARGKRMLVDIGRVDVEVRRPPERLAAYKEAVEARTPFPVGTRFRLRGPWGADDATITGFDTWNGRIVGTLESSPLVDSLAKEIEPLPATAQLVDSISEAVAFDSKACDRGPLSAALEARALFVQDSLVQALLAGDKPPYDRLLKSQKSRSSHAAGCFPGGRAVVIATIWAGEYEWVRQHVMLMDEAGKLSPLRVRDYRFRAHEAIYAVDGDGDGVDDIATRGYGPNLGGTSVLRITPSTNPKDPPRLERMATGFGWEIR